MRPATFWSESYYCLPSQSAKWYPIPKFLLSIKKATVEASQFLRIDDYDCLYSSCQYHRRHGKNFPRAIISIVWVAFESTTEIVFLVKFHIPGTT